jgi:hypothetical protein
MFRLRSPLLTSLNMTKKSPRAFLRPSSWHFDCCHPEAASIESRVEDLAVHSSRRDLLVR